MVRDASARQVALVCKRVVIHSPMQEAEVGIKDCAHHGGGKARNEPGAGGMHLSL